MRLPGYRRLFSNDFEPQYKNLLDKLSGALNSGVEVLYEALNNRLTFRENMASTVAEITVSVDENGTPPANTSFKLSNNLKVEGVFVVNTTDLTTPGAYPPGAVGVSFTPNSDLIVINNIRGLTPGHQYRIKLIALN